MSYIYSIQKTSNGFIVSGPDLIISPGLRVSMGCLPFQRTSSPSAWENEEKASPYTARSAAATPHSRRKLPCVQDHCPSHPTRLTCQPMCQDGGVSKTWGVLTQTRKSKVTQDKWASCALNSHITEKAGLIVFFTFFNPDSE